jgi:hypothetical protein
MKKHFLFAALGLAVALLAFGQSPAKANCRSGYGVGYGGYGSYGGYYGGVGVPSAYRVAPGYGYGSVSYGGYGYGYPNYGSAYRGGHHSHYAAPYGNLGYYGVGYGYGSGLQIMTPGFRLGIGR